MTRTPCPEGDGVPLLDLEPLRLLRGAGGSGRPRRRRSTAAGSLTGGKHVQIGVEGSHVSGSAAGLLAVQTTEIGEGRGEEERRRVRQKRGAKKTNIKQRYIRE